MINLGNLAYLAIEVSKYTQYGIYGLSRFQAGVQNLLKNLHTQRKLLNYENWFNGCQKVPIFDFQSQFSSSKIIGIFHNFFFIEECQLRSTFLFLTFFDNINFKNTLSLK